MPPYNFNTHNFMNKSPILPHVATTPRKILLVLAGAMLPAAAHAQPEAPPEIRVTARLDDPARDGTGGVRSLSSADLGAQAPTSMLETLTLLPGVDAFEKGGIGGGSYLALRGGEPNFALVVINGVRVNDPMLSSGGGFDFSLIGAGDAARLDLLPAPTSTTYGADALSGVVSLRINAPDEATGAQARFGTGSDGRYEVSGRTHLTGGAGSLTIAGSARDTHDFNAGSTASGQSAMVAASPRLGDTIALDLFGFYGASKSQGFPEDSGGPELAVLPNLETRERQQIALGATASARLGADVDAQVRASWGRSTLNSSSPGIVPGRLDGVPPIDSDSRFDRFELVSSLGWNESATTSASIGASLVHEKGTSDGMVDFGGPIPTSYHLSRTLPGIFATAALGLPANAALRAGMRVDFPESGPARLTPRAGADLSLGHSGLKLTASYARGFKQPSFYALGFPLIANPDLKPERSETMDGGLAWTSPTGDWQASMTAYRSVYRDLIDFDPDLFTNVNRQRVSAKGVEFALSGKLGPLRTLASLTYLSTRSADGAPLRFRPEWKGAGVVEWAVRDGLALRLDGRFTSGFLDSSVPTGFRRLDRFATLDAQVAVRLRPGLELRGSLRNLMDEQYSRTIGTPEPGRNVFVALHGNL